MSQEELEIEISPSGQVTMRTKDIKGPVCMDYADLLAKIVGREEHREKTSEYYESAVVEVKRQVNVKQRRTS